MNEEENKLSPSLQDYLKVIYLLNQKEQEVRVTDIARELGLSKPSVNRAMNTLKELQLLEHEHYGTITLTPAGAEQARSILDTYKVIYRFLTEVLDVDEETAAREAHLIEHSLCRDTRKKLKKLTKKLTEKQTDEKKPTEKRTVEKKSDDKKATEKKTAEKKAAEKKPIEKKPIEKKGTEKKTDEKKPAEKKSKKDKVAKTDKIKDK